MKELKRIKVGEFNINQAITISELEKIKEGNALEKYVITIEELFKNEEKLELNDREIKLFLNGAFTHNSKKYNLKDGIYKIYNNNKFIGIGISKNSELKRDIVI